MRINRSIDTRIKDRDLHQVSGRIPAYIMAPNGGGPTEGNGVDLPRTDLHVILLARNPEDRRALARIIVLKPPLWKGKIHAHVVDSGDLSTDDVIIRQAMADLGWGDAKDFDIGPPETTTLGYPSGKS